MVHNLAQAPNPERDSKYIYDFMNRLESTEDSKQSDFDEYFAYDNQGRIVSQRRGLGRGNVGEIGGEYFYYEKTNKLEKVAAGVGGSATDRDMSEDKNFVYDSEGNLIEDKSKGLTISYDWKGMPIEFIRTKGVPSPYKLSMKYDGSGRRIEKTVETQNGEGEWEKVSVTHYTGIGTEVREMFHNGELDATKVVMSMPQGLGRYGVEQYTDSYVAKGENDAAGASFEWYLKNHLGSTMLVYGTRSVEKPGYSDLGAAKKVYDYRSFGEQLDLYNDGDDNKVTENFTGKEKDDETELNYFGARYLDPMLGLWISVDPKRQFASPYLYVGNGANPIVAIDPDGNAVDMTYNTKSGFTTVSDREPSRNPRIGGVSFDSFSGHQPNSNEFGGPIPNGKYLIVPDTKKGHENWFRLLAEDGNIDDVIDWEEGNGRDGFRFHRYNEGTDGCVSADIPNVDTYKALVNWIKGTETYTVKDANNKDLTVYGELTVSDEKQ